MKKTTLALLTAFSLSANAQTVLFDFQTAASGHLDAGSTYNLIELVTDTVANSGTVSFTGLTDTTGSGAYTLDIISDSGWALAAPANTPDGSASGFEINAWDDGIRTNAEADGLTSLVFGGLNDALTYNVVIWAGSGLSFTDGTTYSVGAITSGNLNVTTVGSLISLTGIAPASGSFTLNIQASGTGNALTRGGAINAASLTAIPEPGTLALVGLSLGALLLFRRRR